MFRWTFYRKLKIKRITNSLTTLRVISFITLRLLLLVHTRGSDIVCTFGVTQLKAFGRKRLLSKIEFHCKLARVLLLRLDVRLQ